MMFSDVELEMLRLPVMCYGMMVGSSLFNAASRQRFSLMLILAASNKLPVVCFVQMSQNPWSGLDRWQRLIRPQDAWIWVSRGVGLPNEGSKFMQ